MIERLTDEYRTWGLRLVSLLVIVSFAFIPVRCDASTAPHSIFVAPDMLGAASGHAHHTSGASGEHQHPAKSVPHHSPVGHDASGHQHNESHHAASHDSSAADDAAEQPCSLSLSSGSDPGSQQPVGATLDLPTSSMTPDTSALQPLDPQTQLVLFAPATVLSGVSPHPEAPPPKAS